MQRQPALLQKHNPRGGSVPCESLWDKGVEHGEEDRNKSRAWLCRGAGTRVHCAEAVRCDHLVLAVGVEPHLDQLHGRCCPRCDRSLPLKVKTGSRNRRQPVTYTHAGARVSGENDDHRGRGHFSTEAPTSLILHDCG